jgi:site-specific DNA-methyltransferase (adenine-specific)
VTLIQAIQAVFRKKRRAVHVQELYAELPDKLEHSIRARIYENLGKIFHRVDHGLYVAVQDEAACVVVQGDAWAQVKHIPSRFVDALITDPPYPWLDAILRIHTSTRPRMRWTFEKKDIDRELGFELCRVLKDGAHAFFFVPSETATTRPHIERFILLMESCGFVFNKRWIWHKQVLGMGYSGRGCHEGILFMSKGKRRMPCDLSVPDVLSFNPIDSRVRKHPCEKPRALLEQIIRFATKTGEMVLDCFGGSLSTARAALALGRNSIVIEKDEGILECALV